MAVKYEWVAERMDGEDIVDHRNSDRLAEIWPVDDDEELALVRDTGGNATGLTDRMWAYSRHNMLAAEFTYCGADHEANGTKVPQRFHREIARVSGR